MIWYMKYPGGKGRTFQHVINLMPPHNVYIETHLGGGAVLRNKKPAQRSIAIELDERVIASWKGSPQMPAELIHGKAEDFLRNYAFTGEELVYCDPPYHPATRRQSRVYRHDYSQDDHIQLLNVLTNLSCKVLISGYAHPMYDERLKGWNCKKFEAATHNGIREECLWFNYDPPTELHDARYLGDNFRERQTTRRRLQRLQSKVIAMNAVERTAFMQWLDEEYSFHTGEVA